jgi:hypothetical protein
MKSKKIDNCFLKKHKKTKSKGKGKKTHGFKERKKTNRGRYGSKFQYCFYKNYNIFPCVLKGV